MQLIHRAYTDKLMISPETPHWIFDQCVFFCEPVADDASVDEIADASYSQGDGQHLYTLSVPGDEADLVIGKRDLEADEQARSDIAAIWGDEVDADDLLTGAACSDEDDVEDGGWHIQRIRAQVARRMGYLAVTDRDEQGRVLIVDFAERNDDLNCCWRHLGLVSDVRSAE